MPALEIAGRSPSLTVSAAAAGSAIARRTARTPAARRLGRLIVYVSGGVMVGMRAESSTAPHPAPRPAPSPGGGGGNRAGPVPAPHTQSPSLHSERRGVHER